MTQTITKIKCFFRERLIVTILLTVVTAMLVRPALTLEYFSGVSPDRYWADKINWRHCADIVLAGDSRVYINVAPQSLSESLAGRRIYNFGFSNNAWSAEYLAALEQVLDPKSPTPMIILGINPYSLTQQALTNNKFVDLAQKKQADYSPALDACKNWLEPLPCWELITDLCRGRTAPKWYNEYYPDGWVACDRKPADPTLLLATSRFVLSYKNNPVDPKLTDQLIAHIQKWRNQGIAVYAFRPPVYHDVLAEENRLSGFDESAFVRQLESAGGMWLNLDNSKYGDRTYDGHHLPRQLAVEYSKELGRHIQNRFFAKKQDSF